MAQVMINFRVDEDTKRDMELACKEMGLTMTTAFTIFAKKVGKEKRIPFEITAEPHPYQPRRREQLPQPEAETPPPALTRRQEQLEDLCREIRRSLTAIHTAIPAAITGLPMEAVRLLCGDELKDKAAAVSAACRSLFSGGNAQLLEQKDLTVLDEYTDSLSAIAGELLDVERTLIPAMKTAPGGDYAPWQERLEEVSRQFDGLAAVLRRFTSSTAPNGGAQAARARLQRAAAPVGTPYVRAAAETLEGLILRHYDALPVRAQARLEADYLPTLERALGELARAERDGADGTGEAALCLRAVNVLSQVVTEGGQSRREWDRRGLEAEVKALERLAAMRGDVAGDITPTG